MLILHEIVHGSVLYGTDGPNSDKDYKGIVIPDVEDILLGTAPKTSYNRSSKLSSGIKNTSEDTDRELYTLQAFFRLCEEGQTVATEILFAPEQFWVGSPSKEWETILENKDKLIHKQISAYVGYARQQAAKYGLKGGRVSAVREALDFLEIADYSKLYEYKNKIEQWVKEQNSEFIKIIEIPGAQGQLEPHLEVCNRKVPFHCNFKYAREVFQRIFDEYGKRALLAEKNEGIDWKAVSHAVRVMNQAIELLDTHKLIFPRPDADLLKAIKYGNYDYKTAGTMIEDGLETIQKKQLTSTLPNSIDKEWAREFTLNTYKNYIK